MDNTVRFISRYKDSTVYSVEGVRVAVKDDGFVSPNTTDRQKILLFYHWLDDYADFLIWFRRKNMRQDIALSNYPFAPKFYLT